MQYLANFLTDLLGSSSMDVALFIIKSLNLLSLNYETSVKVFKASSLNYKFISELCKESSIKPTNDSRYLSSRAKVPLPSLSKCSSSVRLNTCMAVILTSNPQFSSFKASSAIGSRS